jgi:hypothetical protein
VHTRPLCWPASPLHHHDVLPGAPPCSEHDVQLLQSAHRAAVRSVIQATYERCSRSTFRSGARRLSDEEVGFVCARDISCVESPRASITPSYGHRCMCVPARLAKIWHSGLVSRSAQAKYASNSRTDQVLDVRCRPGAALLSRRSFLLTCSKSPIAGRRHCVDGLRSPLGPDCAFTRAQVSRKGLGDCA